MASPDHRPGIRLLADDLTGALDSAAAFAGEVPVHLDRAPAGQAGGAARVEALATATRDIPPADLPDALADAIGWLAGADIAFKKVDSLLRGNTFAEVAHIARAGGFTEVVFAPAFPAQGRFLLDGRLCLRPPGRAEGGATAADGPDCAATLAAQGLPGDGIVLHLPELRSDADLRELAATARRPSGERRLWCGSAGLAQALAQVLELAPVEPLRQARLDPQPATLPGPTLLVSASHHPVLRRQWARLRSALPQALAGGRAPDATPAALLAALAEATTARPPGQLIALDLSPAEPLSPEAAAALLARQLAMVAAQAPRPQRLLVIGGDTLRALCLATGATGLRAGAATRSGWGQARLIGGRWDGVACQSRSGAFGAEDDLVEAVG